MPPKFTGWFSIQRPRYRTCRSAADPKRTPSPREHRALRDGRRIKATPIRPCGRGESPSPVSFGSCRVDRGIPHASDRREDRCYAKAFMRISHFRSGRMYRSRAAVESRLHWGASIGSFDRSEYGILVPRAGVEPARGCPQRFLSSANGCSRSFAGIRESAPRRVVCSPPCAQVRPNCCQSGDIWRRLERSRKCRR
jgi:hypothetical protein